MNSDIGIVHADASGLSHDDQELLQAATRCLDLAYAPYSKFYVGAALRMRNGIIVLGANQENASYSLCICGERVALFNKAVHYPDEIVDTLAIRVSSANELDKPAPPCGACLQVINEFEGRQKQGIRILLQGDSEMVYEIESVQKLMPLNFDRSYLDKL